MSNGTHLRCLAPRQYSSEETSQRRRAVGDTVYDFYFDLTTFASPMMNVHCKYRHLHILMFNFFLSVARKGRGDYNARNFLVRTSGGIQPVRTGSIEPSQGILLEQRTG